MTFHIEKDVIPPVLNIVPNTVELVDPNNNNVIDGGEVCKIRFEVANTGKGDAFGCVAKVQANGTTEGLIIEDINLLTIPKNSKQWIEIPIKATEKAKTGQVTLSMYIDEPNGYGTEQISYIIGTHKMRTPLLEVVSYRTKGDTGGKLERRQPFKLQVAVQNTDQGAAVNAIVALKLPNNVNWIGGDEKTQTFTTIEPNETKIFEYELMANQNAAEEIPDVYADGERRWISFCAVGKLEERCQVLRIIDGQRPHSCSHQPLYTGASCVQQSDASL